MDCKFIKFRFNSNLRDYTNKNLAKYSLYEIGRLYIGVKPKWHPMYN